MRSIWIPRCRILLLTLLLASFVAAMMVLPQSGQAQPSGPEADNPMAPDFALETMEGDTFRLSDHRGKVVVINFWAMWCPPCRIEIPGFADLQKAFREEGVQFVGLAVDEG